MNTEDEFDFFFRKSQGESEKIFKSHVESEPSSSESKDTR